MHQVYDFIIMLGRTCQLNNISKCRIVAQFAIIPTCLYQFNSVGRYNQHAQLKKSYEFDLYTLDKYFTVIVGVYK